jgi:hypothetical protein
MATAQTRAARRQSRKVIHRTRTARKNGTRQVQESSGFTYKKLPDSFTWAPDGALTY